MRIALALFFFFYCQRASQAYYSIMQIEGSKETAHRAVYPQGKSSREENLDFSVT